MKRNALKLLVTCFSLLCACSKENLLKKESVPVKAEAETNAVAAEYAIVKHTATPKQTDPAITTNTFGDKTQYAYLPEQPANRRGKLFVFIPGTMATSDNYLQVLQTGAQNGYHTIGLSYDNVQTIETYVGSTSDDSKAANIFEEYLTGNNTSPDVNVPKPNGFENRIVKMVRYMDSLYPSENWKQFVTADNLPKWNLISIAGHSQGADHVMYISKKRRLLRAGFFNGPYNFKLANGTYPSFMTSPGITPVRNIYGFTHDGDPIRVWSDVQLNWSVLNMIGDPGYVDGITYYTGNAHKLLTNEDQRAFTTWHGATVADNSTPYDSARVPVFKKVWIYMCFPK